jgi:hypothetical protein
MHITLNSSITRQSPLFGFTPKKRLMRLDLNGQRFTFVTYRDHWTEPERVVKNADERCSSRRRLGPEGRLLSMQRRQISQKRSA